MDIFHKKSVPQEKCHYGSVKPTTTNIMVFRDTNLLIQFFFRIYIRSDVVSNNQNVQNMIFSITAIVSNWIYLNALSALGFFYNMR